MPIRLCTVSNGTAASWSAEYDLDNAPEASLHLRVVGKGLYERSLDRPIANWGDGGVGVEFGKREGCRGPWLSGRFGVGFRGSRWMVRSREGWLGSRS